MLLFLSAANAHAFCGTFVGSPGAHLVNRTSQVVIARQGDVTTLTLAADFDGDQSDFALLLPVPESLDPYSVRAIDPGVVDRLDRYSTPRLVEYSCKSSLEVDHLGASCGGYYLAGAGCSADYSATDGPLPTDALDVEYTGATGTVTIEAQFQVAEYDVVLLSATGAEGLYDWLDANGFAIPAGGESILQDYIDDGVHFLAAKVHLAGVAAGPSRLSPLQLTYVAEDWVLPIRIGSISAEGEQEVVVYALTDGAAGDVAISNYPEVRVADECMFDEDREGTFADFYRDQLHEIQPDQDIGWVNEYSWALYKVSGGGYHCDPCTVTKEELYDPGELADLGFQDSGSGTYYTYGYGYSTPYASTASGALLTRLRLVYDPADITGDLALYTTGMHNENRQIRYIRYDRRLEFLFPVCGEGIVEDPGMCGDDLDPDTKRGAAGFPLVPALVAALATLGLGARRRRS